MKALKFLSLFLTMMALWSCSSNEEVITPEEETPAKEYMASIGFKGEISISEAPLSRASGNDLYGIQVYSCGATDETNNYKAYAYGLFDDLTKMNIKLIEGYKYQFVATMVVDGKEKIWSSNDGEYACPFRGDVMDKNKISNKFIYSQSQSLINLTNGINSGFSQMVSTDINGFTSHNRPNLDRYYGEHTGYIPTENGNVAIDMKRTVFGLKVTVNNLTEGTLSIAMAEAPVMEITHPDTEIEDIFTFYYVSQAYATENYSETVATTFNWVRTDGVTIPLGTHDIAFKRNKQTIVTVEIDDASVQNALSLSLETGTMGAGNTYTMEGETITDTTVTPGSNE
ncbi:MAG: hypothetical protein IJZ60_03900 [Bacteroides sp.]|nr:hypothetical protein [Bacteroides sp.]